MSEALKLLKRQYKEVDDLFRDCARLTRTNQRWSQHVLASNTLGSDEPVEAGYLAEHFLLAWSDWSGLRERYFRYFGKSEDELPKTWARLHHKCWELSTDLFSDQAFVARIDDWRTAPAERLLQSLDAKHTARLLYHSLIDSHRRAVCMTTLSRPTDNWTSRRRDSRRDEIDSAMGSSGEFRDFHVHMEALHRLPRNIRNDLIIHLQHYRHANLVVSWLFPVTRDRPVGAPLTLTFTAMPRPLNGFLDMHDLDDNYRNIVDRVLRRVQAAIAEIGYENFIDDITSKELVGGDNSVVGADGVNVIPGHGSAVCSPIVLAVAKGDKRTVGFPSVMKQLREHLIRCIGTTKVVIVLCDHWRADMLDDHLGDLRAHYDRGIRFIFLLVASPGNSLSPIAVNLR